jgi:hypothetical protein
MRFDILDKSGKVKYTADVACDENCDTASKIGMAVMYAIKHNINLSGADLHGAKLRLRCTNRSKATVRFADLSGTNMIDTNLVILQTDIWTCYIQKEQIRIGCQVFTIDEWLEFSDEEISKMDSNALAWWSIWKPIILSIAYTLRDETVQLEPCNNEPEAGTRQRES